jgi:hypothetical protein
MNLLPRNWERYYAYSRVGGKLCLFGFIHGLGFRKGKKDIRTS